MSDTMPEPRSLSPRYDARAKVTGAAKYSADFPVPGLVHAFLVQSTIPCGAVASIDSAAAEHAHGVLAVLTPFNAAHLVQTRPALTLLQNPEVHYNGQPIAVVVAASLEQARHAATLLRIAYAPRPAKLDFPGRLAEARPLKQPGREPADSSRGDLNASMARATVFVEETYTTPLQNHNSMEPHTTLAWWEGESLNVYNSSQAISGDRQALAAAFGIPVDHVRVLCPYTGGGFGSKGSPWSHVFLTALAARTVGKPVKLALDRNQMFGPVGGRAATVQTIRLGATPDGKLLGVEHHAILTASLLEDFLETCAIPTRLLYSSEAMVTTHRLVDMNLGVSTYMRAPGEAPGTAAFESAMDELAVKLNLDPVQLRLINYAERDEGRNLPFSSKHLRECYQQAAERFGWSRRKPTPGQVVEGTELIGYGMATATRHALRSAASASVRILPDGRASVTCGSQELGTGTYTIIADTAGEVLGLDSSRIEVKLGDTALPAAPASVGSQTAASICPAIRQAAMQARQQVLTLAANDPISPLHGTPPEDLSMRDGRIFLTASPSTGESFALLIARNGSAPIETSATTEPGSERSRYSANSFGAVFVEVAVDRDTHMVKVRRVVGTYDVGTLINRTTGMNQLIGGVVWGISFALLEEAHIDPTHGRTVNANFAEYKVPVNADIGAIDLTVLNIPDTQFSPLGARGIGEVSVAGIPAAIANAIYNGTGKRVRQFPITPNKIMNTPALA
ncbi:MAG: xanthine dehydrogenase family protein molybdopterin-binding subunit [Acidobacteriota bacterium]|nr:xanthine dehydrogenase family protein molybdopterin-binding subunit [Acidobacteriota bacterium]